MRAEDLRNAARQAIEAAFPVAPLPSPNQMRNDHCPECRELAARFSVRPWPELTLADLSGNPSLSLLTATAFRYYLPAMMLRSMEGGRELDCVPRSLVSELSPPGGKPSEHGRERLAGFTVTQAHAILAFLRHYEASESEQLLDDKSGRRVVARAIKYWSGLAGELA
jgi:hypothetical protein